MVQIEHILNSEESKGDTPYAKLSAGAFRGLTQRLQLHELRKLGLSASSITDLLNSFRQGSPPIRLPYTITSPIKELSLKDLLWHHHHLTKHIQKRTKTRSTRLRKARSSAHFFHSDTTEFHNLLNEISDITKSLDTEQSLLQQLLKQRKLTFQRLNRQNTPEILLDSELLHAVSHTNPFTPLAEDIPPPPMPKPIYPTFPPTLLSTIQHAADSRRTTFPTPSSPVSTTYRKIGPHPQN